MNTRKIDVSLLLAGASPKVVSCKVIEGISELSHARLELASPEDLDVDSMMGQEARLSLSLDGEAAREWTLCAGSASFLGVAQGSLRYELHLYPRLWTLRFITNTRKFRNLSAEQIVSKVLGEAAVPFEWRLTRATAVRKYCSQYRETNLDFVLRLLEHEGIYYWFTPEGVTVLADRSSASPRVEGESRFELIDAAGALDRGELGVHAFRKGARVAPGAATVNDFNWKKPKTPLLATAAAERDAELEIYDYPTGYRRPDQGELLARLRLEALRVPARFVEGRGNVPAFAPARLFDFSAPGGPRFAGEYLLTRVEHRVELRAHQASAGGWTGARAALAGSRGGGAFEQEEEETTYENEFRALPSAVPFRPALVTERPTVEGSHTAMVRGPSGEEIHTDRHGRFRAQFHWDREAVGTDEDSRWLRLLQETATSMALARVGWEMNVAYIDGDPDRPIGLSRNMNGVMTPAYGQPANKTRMTIKTPSSPATGGYNELRLEDAAGSMHFDWRAEKDWVGDVQNDRTETVGNDETHTVGTSYSHAVEHDQKVSIGGNHQLTIKESNPIAVNKNRTKSVSGNETFEVGDALQASTEGSERETVGGDRKTKAGESQGAISRTAREALTRTVGGSTVTTGRGDIQTLVGDTYQENISGAKMTFAKEGNITQSVNGTLKLTVSGDTIRMSTKDMGLSANNSQVEIGAAAALRSNEQISIQGNHIILEADSALTFKSRSLEIAMTPGSTAIKGQLRLESGSAIVATGNPDNLTQG